MRIRNFFICICFFATLLPAAEVRKDFRASTGETFSFRLITPKIARGRKYPLILWLSSGQGAEQQARAMLRSAPAAFLLLPDAPQGAAPVKELLQKVFRENPAADPLRLYLVARGETSGAWEFLALAPELPAAAVLIHAPGHVPDPEKLKLLPVWLFHGDDQARENRACGREWEKAGNRRYRRTEYPGHSDREIAPFSAEPELTDWLFRQRKARR